MARLIDAGDGRTLAENDDIDFINGDFNARVTHYIAQRDGAYRAEVRNGGAEAGAFRLTITRVMRDAPLGAGVDAVYMGALEANATHAQPIRVEAGAFLTITVRGLSGDLDPRVALVDAGGAVVADNDDNGMQAGDLAPFDAYIERYYVERGGLYTVEVTGYQASSGAFAITVNRIGGGEQGRKPGKK